MIFRIFSIALLISAFAFASEAQLPGEPQKDEERAKNVQEMLIKWRIKAEEKEFQELIKRGEEVEKLSFELAKSYSETQQLSPEDTKKLERLEKQIKKIRDRLGAEDEDEEIEEKPKDLIAAISYLQDKSSALAKELRKATRHSISVVAIESSNALLKVLKFIRFGRK